MTTHPAYVIQKDTFGNTIQFKFVDADGAVLDISDADTITADFLKPDGTTETKTCTFVTDGTDGLTQYAWILNDLDQSGVWLVEPRALDTGVFDYRGEVRELLVREGI